MININEKIQTFIDFTKTIEGYEKGEAQTFLNRLFQIFGYADCHDAGGKFEKRTKIGKKTKFEDLLLPGKAIIEMKSRGKELQSHILQAREYWNHSYNEEKTPYVILCNFDQFWIFNWFMQDAPLDKLGVEDLGKRWRALAFLSKDPIEPVFENNVEKVTKEAAEKLLKIYHSLVERGADKNKVQKFVLQLLVCLFSEDIGLFPIADYFLELIFKDVNYFNGGIFKQINPIELNAYELDLLEKTAKFDWSRIEPAIFGNIFEYSMDNIEKHAAGAHYTCETDIMKIIRPTIINPFLEKINKADTLENLLKIRDGLGKVKVLDPACGSGNFLYIALRELKKLELEILSKINENFSSYRIDNVYSIIQMKQFYGIDMNPFAVELAKVTLSFGKKIFNDMFLDFIKKTQLSLYFEDKTLPFDDLDSNIIVNDALFCDWQKTDFIIGNPPFLGGRYLRSERGDEYAEKVYKAYPDTKGQPDYCALWFQKAHNSPAKRIGLVGTNSVAQGVTRKAGLEYITSNKGIITNAVSTQVWSGTANVHVSIVNWVKNKKDSPQNLYLDGKKVKYINSSLKAEADYTGAARLAENLDRSFEGCQLAGKGFVIPAETAENWIKTDKKNKDVLKPMIDGKSLVNPGIELDWVIDFNDMPLEQAARYDLPFEHVEKNVKPVRDTNNRKARKVYWWQFGEKRPGMRKALYGLKCYFCLPKIAKYTCFRAIDISILPCEANMVVASDDFFILGILNSRFHLNWVLAQGSTLGKTTRYTNTTCFETFPFPDDAGETRKEKVRSIIKELEKFRTGEAVSRKCTITEIYNKFFHEPSSTLFNLHKKLDKAVCDCYQWKYSLEKNYNNELFQINRLKSNI
ncbi:SAM-dependent methyltransferase [Desulfonema limicola]|uniref:site-specific DNA-methyltransferase (adenine-specific) n=1 Tax=Desulfonema limicola TaxID=45656 RepID=A0A975BCN4_9BACT|nr:DNA methyltransferase [Desulfonema limicola]QTA82936.1 SAM-dependent methyltransferase [Desulfonema limicola]